MQSSSEVANSISQGPLGHGRLEDFPDYFGEGLALRLCTLQESFPQGLIGTNG